MAEEWRANAIAGKRCTGILCAVAGIFGLRGWNPVSC